MTLTSWTWNDAKVVAMDFETSGKLPEYALQPWRFARGDAWLTSASAIHLSGGELSPWMSQLFPKREQIKALLEHAIANDLTLLGWNITFDISWIIAMGLGDLAMKVRWLDGMLLWRHLEVEPEYEFQSARHKRRSYALKPAGMQHWLPHVPVYNDDVDFHATDPESLAKLQKYNDRDNVYTWVIAKMIWPKLTPAQQRAALVEAESLPMVAQANLEGLVIDRLTVKHLCAKLDDDAAARLHELAPEGMTEKIVRSPKQLAELLFDQWKLPVLKTNKSKVEGKEDSRSTDKEVLHELAFLDSRVKRVKMYREALNAKGKFGTSVIEALDYNEDGRAHPISHIFSTYSGRMTVSSKQGKNKDARPIGFALHQMKREKEFREIVTVEDGYDIVEFDAAGQEFRWMAEASRDPTMLGLCQPGEDAHSFMGAQIVGMDYQLLRQQVRDEIKAAVQNRYLGKFANLCISSGTPILTDRGACAIEDVRDDDLVWDGEEFVTHSGVRFSGILPVIEHDGVRGTPDHKVMVNGRWIRLDEAAAAGSAIDRAKSRGSVFRIVDGIARRVLGSRRSSLRLRAGNPRAETQSTGREIDLLQKLRDAREACAPGAHGSPRRHGSPLDRPGGGHDPAMPQSERPLMAQLWRTWDQIRLCLGARGGGVHPTGAAASDLRGARHRPRGQRGPLRSGEPAAGPSTGEPAEYAAHRAFGPGSRVGRDPLTVHGADHAQDAAMGSDLRGDRGAGRAGSHGKAERVAADSRSFAACYDIVNCGPRTRFAANGRIVHNSLQYRTGARKLRVKARTDYDIPLELPEAQRIHATYQRSYPGVPAYWASQIAKVKGLGYVETFAGRRVQVVGNWDGEYGWSMGSTALNYRIQGTGADQKYLALAVIKDYVNAVGGRLLFELHDGLYLVIPSRLREKAILDIKHLLDNLPYQQAWGFTPSIPMPWDCKYGKVWGHLKEFKFD